MAYFFGRDPEEEEIVDIYNTKYRDDLNLFEYLNPIRLANSLFAKPVEEVPPPPPGLTPEEAGAIYSQPLMTNEEIAKYGAGNYGTKIPFVDITIPRGHAYMTLGDMMGNLRYNPDGTFKSIPTTGTSTGDVLRDAGKSVYENSRLPYIGTGAISPEQLVENQLNTVEEEQRQSDPEVAKLINIAKQREEEVRAQRLEEQNRMSLMSDAMSSYGARPTPSLMSQEREPMVPDLPPYVAPEVLQDLGVNRAGGPVTPEQKMYEGLTPDLQKQMDAIREANRQAAEQQRLANIQSNIAQQDEMESGYVKYQITGNNEIDNVISNAIDATVEKGTILGEEVSEITASAIETLGPMVEQGMEQAKMLGQEAMDYMQNEAVPAATSLMQDEIVPAATSLFEEASDAVVTTTQSLLADDPADESSSEDMAIDEGKTTDVKTTDVKTNTVTTSTDSSQGSNGEVSTPKQAEAVVKKTFAPEGGFNMDRLTNPLSPENRAWWFEQRPGDIPGNNRAVEFFNALAYIGTPLKYRPAKTPMETLQERRIQHSNNLMDAAASRQTALQAGSNAAFTRLKGMIIKPETLQNSYLTDTKSDSWFKRTFGDGLTGEQKEAQSYQTAIQINQIMTELAMAGVPPSKAVAEGLYTIRQATGRPIVSTNGQVTAEEKRLASLPKSELRDIIKKAESGNAVSNYFSLKQ